MKMLYFVQYFPPEKASGLSLVMDLLEGFANYGWDIDVYTSSPTRGIDKVTRKKKHLYTKLRRYHIVANVITNHKALVGTHTETSEDVAVIVGVRLTI